MTNRGIPPGCAPRSARWWPSRSTNSPSSRGGLTASSRSFARADAYLARIDRDLEATRRHQELHRGHLVELVHEADRELITPEHIRRFSVTGTSDELVERVHALAVDGVNELAI